MGIVTYKPVTSTLRYQTKIDYSVLSKKRPWKKLLKTMRKTGGRNNTGRITARFIGGGHKRRYRVIDFKRNKWGIPGRVESIEYDPNRSSFISLIVYRDGERRYMITPVGLSVGDEVLAAEEAEIKAGNHLVLKNIPVGTAIHNIELYKGRGGQIVRSAGSMAQLIAKEGGLAQLRLPSGEVRVVNLDCSASIGQVSNADHVNVTIGKAGRVRWKGRLPRQRGVSMNPVDHPHGGGEGKSKGGNHPVSIWGTPAKGFKTRHSKRTDQFIVKDRRSKI